MKRRTFLKGCAAGAGSLAALPKRAPAIVHALGDERPNILWLDAEDLCPELGCYATPLVRTPNLDALAAGGVRFENAFASCPVCSPSRSAIMTGRYQTSIGAHHHRSNRDKPLPPGVPFITEALRAAGYFTVNGAAGRPGKRGKQDFNFAIDKPYDGTDWRQRAPGQPFFAQMHFNEAHRKFHRDAERPIDPDAVELPPYYPDHPVARLDWALYLETVQNLDRKVGALLERLEEDGLTENTAIFFTGDHGRCMVRGKQWLYEGGIRVPLIVRRPGEAQAGQVREDLASLLDLAPTWLAMAGAAPLAQADGRNLFDAATPAPTALYAARDRCDATQDRIRCVRTARHKYIRNFHPERPYTQLNEYKTRQYPVVTLLEVLHKQGKLTPAQARFMPAERPPEELYDLASDPHEVHNLAGKEEHRATLEGLRGQLDAWIARTGDQGAEPEAPEAIREAEARDKTQSQTTRKRLGFDPREEPERYLEWWSKELKAPKRGA